MHVWHHQVKQTAWLRFPSGHLASLGHLTCIHTNYVTLFLAMKAWISSNINCKFRVLTKPWVHIGKVWVEVVAGITVPIELCIIAQPPGYPLLGCTGKKATC